MNKKLKFYKYQGAGNDFILLDNREKNIHLTEKEIAQLCHRNFGIGADGLMLLENIAHYDFKMVYYNADGNESTMCGNGGRCIAAFAKYLGINKPSLNFYAIDGAHTASINADNSVTLQMIDVPEMNAYADYTLLNTGSPHYVAWLNHLEQANVYALGKAIRYREEFGAKGINVNFMTKTPKGLFVRTYERGVENETLSCGTGVTAAAIASTGQATGKFEIAIESLGGALSVQFEKDSATSARQVYLSGPAQLVFEGTIQLTT